LGLLRILLAICVLSGHSGRPLGHLRWLEGDLAVELFFVISGFYMQLVLSTRYTKAKLGESWVSQFYKARYLRLLPTYLVWSVIVAVAGLVLPTSTPYSVWRYVWDLPNTVGNFLFKGFLCFTNTTMFFQDVTMYFAVHNGQVHWSNNFRNSDVLLYRGLTIPPAWSLGIELSFYLIAPYLLKLRSRWLLIGSCSCLAAKVITIEALRLGDPWSYRFFPFELGYFLLGALAFRFRHRTFFVSDDVGPGNRSLDWRAFISILSFPLFFDWLCQVHSGAFIAHIGGFSGLDRAIADVAVSGDFIGPGNSLYRAVEGQVSSPSEKTRAGTGHHDIGLAD
jgi:peptidoglycan/LPS O-acetylase OafA/YrhL